jgi:hypothetical protein
MPTLFGMQDIVPAESSIISKLLEANNKATGTNFTHMYVKRNANQNVCAVPHEIAVPSVSNTSLWTRDGCFATKAVSLCSRFLVAASALQALCTFQIFKPNFGCVHVSTDSVLLASDHVTKQPHGLS